MNVTLASLTIAKLATQSPFLATSQLSLRSVLAKHFFSSFLYSKNPTISLSLSSSSFCHFLASAINVDRGEKMCHAEDQNGTRLLLTHSCGNVTVARCSFRHCNASNGGGIYSNNCNVYISDSVFYSNQAEIGGGAHILRCHEFNLTRVLVYNNTASYDGGLVIDIDHKKGYFHIQEANFTKNQAKLWTGALRVDRSGGTTKDCYFDTNSALVCGGYFDFSWNPAVRTLNNCVFKNNTSVARGGAYTAYHIQHRSQFDACWFCFNYCSRDAYSISIENVDSECNVTNCMFSEAENYEIRMKIGESEVSIENCKFNIYRRTMEKMLANVLRPLALDIPN